MMTVPKIGAISTPNPAEPKKIEDAAREFESLLIAQMLKSARESASSGLGEKENASEDATMLDMADQQFAQLLAQRGGIGLTHLVVNGLNKSKEI